MASIKLKKNPMVLLVKGICQQTIWNKSIRLIDYMRYETALVL